MTLDLGTRNLNKEFGLKKLRDPNLLLNIYNARIHVTFQSISTV